MALFGATRSYIGLDLGGSTLKAVELINRHKRVELSTYVTAPIPEVLSVAAASDAEQGNNTELAASALRDILRAADVSADAVVVSLPSTGTFSVSVELADLPNPDITRTLRFAVRDQLPIDVDSAFLLWSRHGEPPHTGEAEGDDRDGDEASIPQVAAGHTTAPVFVTAVPKQIVEYYTAVFQTAELEPIAFEPEVFPLKRSLLPQSGTAQIVDIGARTCTIHLVERGVPLSSRTTECESESLSNAERIRELINQIHSSEDAGSFKQTILTGGRAHTPGLLEAWSKAIGHAVVLGSPWHELSYPAALGAKVDELGPQFALAIGLAEREMPR